MHEKLRELQRQADHEKNNLVIQLREAEVNAEDERNRSEKQTSQLLDENRELLAKLESLEKHFRANKDYLEVSHVGY